MDKVTSLDDFSPVAWRAKIDWEKPGQLFLSPMVRSSSLSMRATALQYGAAAVYSEVIIDQRLNACVVVEESSTKQADCPFRARAAVETKSAGSIDASEPIYRGPVPMTRLLHPDSVKAGPPYMGDALVTCPGDAPLVVQIGSACPERAAVAAAAAAKFGSCVDLNAGCCHRFANKGGMGAELLNDVPKLCAILRAMRAAVPADVDVSVKTRLFRDHDSTVALIRDLAETGVRAIAIHVRVPGQDRKSPPRWARLGEALAELRATTLANAAAAGVEPPAADRLDILVNSAGQRVVVLANGGIWTHSDADAARRVTCCQGILVARTAVQNMAFFAEPLTGAAAPPPPVVLQDEHGNIQDSQLFFVKAHACIHAGVGASPLLYARRALVNAIALEAPLRNARFNLTGIFRGSPLKTRMNNALAALRSYGEVCALLQLPGPAVIVQPDMYASLLAQFDAEEAVFRAAASAGLGLLSEAGAELADPVSEEDEEHFRFIVGDRGNADKKPYTADLAAFGEAGRAAALALSPASRRVVNYALVEERCIHLVAMRERETIQPNRLQNRVVSALGGPLKQAGAGAGAGAARAPDAQEGAC